MRHVGASERAFRADFLQFSHFEASNSKFSYEFSHEPPNLRPQNRCFVRGFRQFSSHLTKRHACHGICTLSEPLSPLDAALTMRFAQNTQQHDTSKVLRLPRTMTRITSKVLAVTKTGAHLLKTSQKYCACHTKRLSNGYETRLNVTKCHTCHAKRSNATSATSKSDPFCRTYHRHGHTPYAPPTDGCKLLRTVANGCERLRTVAVVNATSSEHTLNPQTPRVKREPLLRIREKKHDWNWCWFQSSSKFTLLLKMPGHDAHRPPLLMHHEQSSECESLQGLCLAIVHAPGLGKWLTPKPRLLTTMPNPYIPVPL